MKGDSSNTLEQLQNSITRPCGDEENMGENKWDQVICIALARMCPRKQVSFFDL
jgi:hypothetical protein